jgi:hypothetical protein
MILRAQKERGRPAGRPLELLIPHSPEMVSLYDTNRLVRHGPCPHRLSVGDGSVLTYVTGGLAYGEVKINGTNTVSGFAHIDQQGSFTGNFAVS